MRTASVPVTDRTVANAPTGDQTVGGFFALAMDVARACWPSKTAEELAAIFNCAPRSAERYLAGDRTGDADKLGALIVSTVGAVLITQFATRMPPQRRAAFWKELAKAARRAELLEERDRLERELRQVSG